TRGGFGGQVLALALGGVLIGPAVPNATGRVTLIAPAVGELIEALGYAPGSVRWVECSSPAPPPRSSCTRCFRPPCSRSSRGGHGRCTRRPRTCCSSSASSPR